MQNLCYAYGLIGHEARNCKFPCNFVTNQDKFHQHGSWMSTGPTVESKELGKFSKDHAMEVGRSMNPNQEAPVMMAPLLNTTAVEHVSNLLDRTSMGVRGSSI